MMKVLIVDEVGEFVGVMFSYVYLLFVDMVFDDVVDVVGIGGDGVNMVNLFIMVVIVVVVVGVLVVKYGN